MPTVGAGADDNDNIFDDYCGGDLVKITKGGAVELSYNYLLVCRLE